VPSLHHPPARTLVAIALVATLLMVVPGPAHAVTLSGALSAPVGPSADVPFVAAPAWFNVTPNQRFSPPPLVGSSLVYDPADSEAVLFGGCTTSACPASAQTWVYAGGSWTNITTASAQPPARSYAGLVYDSRDGYALLFGGRGADGLLNDTWGFSAGVWTNLTNLSTPTPSPRWATQIVFDRYDDYVVLFGGCSSVGPLNDTWHFVSGQWKNVTSGLTVTPPARYGGAFAFDSGDNYALLQNGCGATCPLNDTWEFTHGHWAPVALNVSAGPAPREFATLTYDVVQNATFLVGGNDSAGPLGDTWRWAGGRWANVTSVLGSGPSPRFGAAALPTTVAYVGNTAHRWTFDMIFGGTAGPSPFSLAKVNGETWVAEPAPGSTASVLPSVVEVGQVATFTATASAGSAPYVYLWQFGDGASSAAQDPTHDYPRPGGYAPNLTVSDSAGVIVRTSTTLTVVVGPAVDVTVAPMITDVGRPVSFGSSVSGGTSPYQYRWAFGDGGSATTSTATHSFAASGTFEANLTVTDTVQGIGVEFTNVTVHDDPTLTTMLSTATPVVGAPVTFAVSVALGTGPFQYEWAFGDGGVSTNASSNHSYTAPGVYGGSVTVTDAAGSVVVQNFSVHAGAAPAQGPERWGGLTSVQWGILILALGAVVAGASAVFLVVRHRRGPPGSPIAAAAVGQPRWDSEDTGASGPPSSSRSFRRSYRR
jgi:PKD repeat protein